MSLSVVYVPDTGHVVGAVNVTGPSAPTEVSALVGAELPVRISLAAGEIAVLPLPARQLAVLAADDEPEVFADPLAFGVEAVEGSPPKPTLLRLASWSKQQPSFTTSGLVVTVPVPNASRITKVLALVSDGADTHVLAGEIPEAQESVTLPVTVDGGPHGVLVLAEGWAGRLVVVEKS